MRKELRGLGVSVFVVKTVREQMRYDTPRLVVEAGKPFEVIFENVDAMPHNFVVVEPGTRQAVAEAVQTHAARPTRQGRPRLRAADSKTSGVLAATKLARARAEGDAQAHRAGKEGEYEYVCTFPGHWMIMWGKLVVTKDVDAYLQANPVPAESETARRRVRNGTIRPPALDYKIDAS